MSVLPEVLAANELYAAEFGGWRTAFAIMAGFMVVGMVTIWSTQEPVGNAVDMRQATSDAPGARLAAWLASPASTTGRPVTRSSQRP